MRVWILFCICVHLSQQQNPPLPPAGPKSHRIRLPHLRTSYSFTATPSVTSPSSALSTPSIMHSFLHNSNSNNNNGNKSSSSPPLPRSRERRQRNATVASLPPAHFRSRAATPPPRRKWDCSMTDSSMSAVNLAPSTMGDAENGGRATQLQVAATQLNLLTVPDIRRKDGGGRGRTSSKSSLSSRESTAEGGTFTDGIATSDWDGSIVTGGGGASTMIRRRNMDSKRKSARQSIRSLFSLVGSRDAA